jgi:hypothetical protein
MFDSSFARTRLESVIAQGRTSAGPVVEQILAQIPDDELVPAASANVAVDTGRCQLITATSGAPMSDHAFTQLTARLGVPTPYARELLQGSRDGSNPWMGQLLGKTLSEHLAHSDERYLVRRVDGATRAVLSDKFKRMDSRPLLDAFIKAVGELGGLPLSGHATETRVAVRAIIPVIYEPVPGEAVALGLHWGNSDFGAGSYHVTLFMLRLVCLNGLVGDAEMRKTHVGARLEEGIEYSRRTHLLTERALISATRDVVHGVLAPAAIEERLERIRAVHAEEVDFETAWRKVGKVLTKSDKEGTRLAFESPDVINMPRGNTMWRFANALSWVANGGDVSEERRLDLQAAAGKLI